MKIVSFNIRCDCGVDKENNFIFRKPFILKKIMEEVPDIICFQEMMDHMECWLSESLPDYHVVGCGRNANLDGERMSIAIRKQTYSLIAADHFWLSNTPTVPGSQFPSQCGIPRMCTQCYVMERKSKKVLRIANTHLDHGSAAIRAQAMQLIEHMLSIPSMYKEAVTLLVGDFNAQPHDSELTLLMLHPQFRLLTPNIGLTYHGYFEDKTTSYHDTSPHIDHIFLRGAAQVHRVVKWMDVHDGVYLSDHYPVAVELSLDVDGLS